MLSHNFSLDTRPAQLKHGALRFKSPGPGQLHRKTANSTYPTSLDLCKLLATEAWAFACADYRDDLRASKIHVTSRFSKKAHLGWRKEAVLQLNTFIHFSMAFTSKLFVLAVLTIGKAGLLLN